MTKTRKPTIKKINNFWRLVVPIRPINFWLFDMSQKERSKLISEYANVMLFNTWNEAMVQLEIHYSRNRVDIV